MLAILPPASLLLLLDFDPTDDANLAIFRSAYPSMPDGTLPWQLGQAGA